MKLLLELKDYVMGSGEKYNCEIELTEKTIMSITGVKHKMLLIEGNDGEDAFYIKDIINIKIKE